MTDIDVAVLVVGAGPTGLLAAGELARHGVDVRIVDRLEAPKTTSRALVNWPRTLELYDDIGVIDEVLATGVEVHGLNAIYSRDKHYRIDFEGVLKDSEERSQYSNAYNLSQHDTERILTERLTGLGISIERGLALTGLVDDGEGVTATLQRADGGTETIRAGWVIGCDGAHSAVRTAIGVPFEGATYHEEFIMADAELDWELPDGELYTFISKPGIYAAFAMPGEHRFRIFGNVEPGPDGPSAEYSEPTDAEFQAMTDERVPYPTRITKKHWVSRYRLHRRAVPQYRTGRTFLVGDAAHVHSPAGAQGMNTGLQDAYNLAWKLALVARGVKTGLGAERLLDSYHADRHPVGERLLKTSDRMFAVIAGRKPTMEFIRQHVMPGVGSRLLQTEAVRHFLIGMLSELHIAYPDSPLNAESGQYWGTAPKPGERAREATLGSGRLYDVLRGTHHTVLLFEDTVDLTGLAVQISATYPELVVARVIGAEEKDARSQYGVERAAAFVIRPDKYVGYRGAPEDVLSDLAQRLG
ncbi:FAD-dependent monooxygenase [Kribbella sp. NPDC058245]|uniref:FAD-dependent monooxygenase n=1 Tax=Kribbella sp. NPDC058245 TaxID=3346399 RepID=UPI0036F10F9A